MTRFVAFVVASAVLSSSAFGADVEPGCAGGECLDIDSEESALVQRKIQEHQQKVKLHEDKFPDLGDLKDSISDTVGDVKDTVGDLGVGVLTTFADSLSDHLKSMREKVEDYSKEVNGSCEDLKKGVATILAKAFNVTIEEIPTGSKYEEKAMDMLDEADSTWSLVSKSMQTASATIDTGLAALGSSADDLRKKVNATMQSALAGGKGVLKSVETLKEAVDEAKSKAKDAVSHEDKDDSLLQTKLDPSEVLGSLNSAVAEASNQASAFAQSFSDAFETLSKEVTDIVGEKLSSDDLPKVRESFEKVQLTATKLAKEVVAASQKLFSGVTEATAAAGDAAGVKSAAVGQPLVRWGLSLAAAVAFAAV